jgi:hypothetical protein
MRNLGITVFSLVGIASAAFVGMGGPAARAQSTPANESRAGTTVQTPEKRVSAKQTKLMWQTRITMNQAQEIALKKTPGDVKSAALEKKHGKIVYAFDIQQLNERTMAEVQVSALDGSVVSIKKESAANEAEGARQHEAEEKKAAAKGQQKPQPR